MSLIPTPSDIPNIENLFYFFEGATFHIFWHSLTSFCFPSLLTMFHPLCLSLHGFLPNPTRTKLTCSHGTVNNPPIIKDTALRYNDLIAFLLTHISSRGLGT